MVCPWFVHGSSMVPPSIRGKSMDKPWSNHEGTMEKVPRKVLFDNCFV
ncbi:MAG: hypothetical protein N4A37_08540 [Prolixibacteraceae bacterium]|nr:hypothetical protein [Prolixibacteraceae bacterium]